MLCDSITAMKLKYLTINGVDYVHIEFVLTKKIFFSLLVIWIIYKEVKCDSVKLHCDLQLADEVYGLQGSSQRYEQFSWTEILVRVFNKWQQINWMLVLFRWNKILAFLLRVKISPSW